MRDKASIEQESGSGFSARLSDLLTLAAGPRSKWVVLAFWVLLIAALAPFAGRFESAQENDAATFLPADAQSTRAVELSREFSADPTLPAIIVYRRESGFTQADRERVQADHQAILAQNLPGVIPAPVPPQFSEDGQAALLVVPIAPGDEIALLNDAVSAIRDQVSGDRDGLRVRVTGPAGFTSDLTEVFGNINVQLFTATALIVAVLLFFTYRSPFLWLIPLGAVVLAEFATRGVGYWLATAGVTINGQTAGLLVDAVSDILDVDRAELQAPPDLTADKESSCISALTLIENRLIRLLQLEAVLPAQQTENAA